MQIFYYSVSIFTKAGLSEVNAQWANLGAGCLNLCISLLGPLLMATCNRRSLMMLSSALCAIFLFGIAFVLNYIVSSSSNQSIKKKYLLIVIYNLQDAVSWFPWACIVCIMGYIFFYQFGLGPIPYFIGSGNRSRLGTPSANYDSLYPLLHFTQNCLRWRHAQWPCPWAVWRHGRAIS